MGSAVGTSPGRLVETDADFNIIHEWPEDVDGTLNILTEQFSPHGLSIDFEKDIILTSDFVVPLTVLKPSLGAKYANTLRLWNLSTRKILSTITIPDVSFSLFSSDSNSKSLISGTGWRYPGRQVHPRQPRERCPCYVSHPFAISLFPPIYCSGAQAVAKQQVS